MFTQNLFGINPAFAGLKKCAEGKIGLRYQWYGLDESPRTAYFNLNGRFPSKKRKKYGTDFHGWGGMAEADRSGPYSRTNVALAYAYNFPLNRKTRISAGLSLGTINYRLGVTSAKVIQTDDPLLSQSYSKWLFPDINPGILVYSDIAFLSFNLRQAIPLKMKLGEEEKLRSHLITMAGYKLWREKPLSFTPAVRIQWAPVVPLAIDIQAAFDYKRHFGFGLGYRNIDAFYGFFKVFIKNQFTINYSFDYTLSSMKYSTTAYTHEITLGIYTCKIFREQGVHYCPAFQ